MLAGAVRKSLQGQKNVRLIDYLCLVALGTIADLAPLRGPNRIMVQQGLKILQACEWPGLLAMKRSLRLDGQSRISVRDVGFKLAPRLNAAGRLGSAGPALDILLTDDPEEAGRLARELDVLNKIRYDAQASLVDEALEMLEMECLSSDMTVVLAKEGWPKGVLGLAASRLAERSGKPAVLLTIEDGLATGSGRTAGSFDLFMALSKVRRLCLSMGGHSQAAGLKVPTESLESFREAFEEAAREQKGSLGQSELEIDLACSLPDLGTLAPHLAELEPYGQAHPSPVLAVMGLSVLHAVCSKGGRVDLRLSDGLARLNVSGFNLASRLEEVGPAMDVALAFDPDFGGYGGYSGYGNAWRLVDFRPAGQAGGF
jgi:single-stranded-DNA-specific exonuclease